jgi:deoxyribodipyrimidine photo-lyase
MELRILQPSSSFFVYKGMPFNLFYPQIIERISAVDPITYARTRNFLNGSVTQLSPFISRGVISGKQVLDEVLKKGYKPYQIEKFIQELAWREYFQRVWQAKGDLIWKDIKQPQPGVQHCKMVHAVHEAKTGIEAIDRGINELFEIGYMHNHMRMYVSSITCNIAGAHWEQPARWLYYHLLDGDMASNNCSWQWVAGAFSSKKYYCNQENINKYTGSTQRNSFLDQGYDEITCMPQPETMKATVLPVYITPLPSTQPLKIDPRKPTLVYNSYNLDPLWRKELDANRVLLLEPSHFRSYPVSAKVMEFILRMADNIEGLQIHVAEFTDLTDCYKNSADINVLLISKEHPAFQHYQGTKDERDWIFPSVTGYHSSFSGYWKKCDRHLRTRPNPHQPMP